jgi:hypothetical protein
MRQAIYPSIARAVGGFALPRAAFHAHCRNRWPFSESNTVQGLYCERKDRKMLHIPLKLSHNWRQDKSLQRSRVSICSALTQDVLCNGESIELRTVLSLF